MTHNEVEPRRARHSLATVLLAGLMTSLLLMTGCSSDSLGPGVAAVKSSTHPGTSPSSSTTKASALAYSQCMRSHGVKDFPDPNSDGQIRLEAHPGSDLDFNNPTFKAADAACKSLRPGADSTEHPDRAAVLKYSQCMRSHGIKDFPDPNSEGGLQLQVTPGSDLDPNNPQFKAADKACQKLIPGGGLGGSTHSNNGSGS